MEPAPRKPDVDPSAFGAIDLRVGVVREVEDFPAADPPAWKLRVDFGAEIGTLATSARVRAYGREELLGRRVIGVVNLGVRRIADFESAFLLLGAVQPDGAVILLDVASTAAPGSPVA